MQASGTTSGAASRQAYDAWLDRVADTPWAYDFYQVLRRVAGAHPELPALGEGLRPVDEPVRVAQPAALEFPPAPLHGVIRHGGAPPLIMQHIFGLLGPNGALPLHLTEYARDRAIHHGDHTLQRFLDTLTHRFALLFYRAWADAQPIVSLDRPGNKAYVNRLGSLVGIGLRNLQDRDALPDVSRLHFAGRLARQTRDAEGLLAWCRSEFAVAVDIQQWCGHWMPLEHRERSRLGRRSGATLGRSVVLGATVWDVQHKFRIQMGPLTLAQYLRLLPGSPDLARLQAMVRQWLGLEFAWDVKLTLARAEVPLFALASVAPPSQASARQLEGDDNFQGVALSGADDIEPAALRVDESEPGVRAARASAASFEQPAALLSEGHHDVELVAVQDDPALSGSHATLVFRVASGSSRGVEITETVPLRAASQSRLREWLRALGAPGETLEGARQAVGRRCRLGVRHAPGTGGSVRAVVGVRTGLGHSTWLGHYRRNGDADDLRLDVERPPAHL